jgi:hypothetical protein
MPFTASNGSTSALLQFPKVYRDSIIAVLLSGLAPDVGVGASTAVLRAAGLVATILIWQIGSDFCPAWGLEQEGLWHGCALTSVIQVVTKSEN